MSFKISAILIVILSSFVPDSFSQELCESTVYKVYDNLLNSIGNTNPRAPELLIKNSTRNPAGYNPLKKQISIEKKVLEICFSFGADSLNALSFILAHELGHHYRHHGWMSQYASLDFSRTLKSQHSTPEQRQVYETEADIYSGFYAHMAGYDAMKVAESFLDSIYKNYSLPNEIENYPSLKERKAIVLNNKKEFEELKIIFDLANILMSSGNYSYAQELFQYILDKGFTSREIYNNLGLCYVYEALELNIESKDFNLIFPFKLDVNSRLVSQSSTRGYMSTSERAKSLLHDAQKEFEKSIHLDPDYSLAKENLYYSQLVLAFLGETQSLNTDEILELENVCSGCVNGCNYILNNKYGKAKSTFKNHSSKCIKCKVNQDFKKNTLEFTLPEKTKEDDLFNDIDMFCFDFSLTDSDFYEKLTVSSVGVETVNDIKVYRLKRRIKGKRTCVGIQEIASKNEAYENSVGIYVNDPESKILEHYKQIRRIDASSQSYITILGTNLTFLLIDGVVKKWFYFIEM